MPLSSRFLRALAFESFACFQGHALSWLGEIPFGERKVVSILLGVGVDF